MFTQVTIITENDGTWWGTKYCYRAHNNGLLKTLLTEFDSKDKVNNLSLQGTPLCDSESGVYVACAIATEEFDESEYIYVFCDGHWNFYRKSDASLIPFVPASNLEVE